MKIDDPLALPAAVEKHFQVHKADPCETREYMGYKVYLADSGPHFDAKENMLSDEDRWMKDGYYLSCWAVIRDNYAVWGRPVYFETNHNRELTNGSRREARLNAAMADAEDYIRLGIQGGLLENRSQLIMPRVH